MLSIKRPSPACALTCTRRSIGATGRSTSVSPTCVIWASTCQGAFVALAPFRRRQISPAHSARDEIVTVVLQHAQKRFVGPDDSTFEVPDEDPQNVGAM